MNYCIQCGTQIDDDESLCRGCAMALTQAAAMPPDGERHFRLELLHFVLAVLLVSILAVLIFGGLSHAELDWSWTTSRWPARRYPFGFAQVPEGDE